MANKTITINLNDSMSESIFKGQAKRLAALESAIKKKKKKEDVMSELRKDSVLKAAKANIKSLEKQTNKLVKALSKQKAPTIKVTAKTQGNRIVPFPS